MFAFAPRRAPLAPSPWLAAATLALFIGAVVATFRPRSHRRLRRRAAFGPVPASASPAAGRRLGPRQVAFWPLPSARFGSAPLTASPCSIGMPRRRRRRVPRGRFHRDRRGGADCSRANSRRPCRGGLTRSSGRECPDRGGGACGGAGCAFFPPRPTSRPRRRAACGSPGWRLAPVDGGAAAAWFGMMAVMAFAPIGLAGCGVFPATVGAVARHLVAMYAPALALGLRSSGWGADGGWRGARPRRPRRRRAGRRPVRRRSCWPSLRRRRLVARHPAALLMPTAIVRPVSDSRAMCAFCRPESPARWSRDSYSDPGVGWARRASAVPTRVFR
jgi:hypothetical protein